MDTLKADKYRRVTLPGIDPLTIFEYQTSKNGITLKPIKPVLTKPALIKPVKGPNGLYRLPKGTKLTSEEITLAVRADRDAR